LVSKEIGGLFPMTSWHIVFASGKALFPIGEGGGETIAHDLLLGLSSRGWGVRAFGQATYEDVPRLNDALCVLGCELTVDQEQGHIRSFAGKTIQYPSRARFSYEVGYQSTLISPGSFLDHVDKKLASTPFNFFLFQAERSPELLNVARRHGVYPIFYAQNGLELRQFERPQDLPLVLANSAFFRDRLRKDYKVHCELLYPAVDLERYRVACNTHEYVTMINPVAVKGIGPFLTLAAALPNRKFLVVEGWGTQAAILELIRTKLPNVTYLGKQVDMRAVYGQTHILVVPSQWEESFGRVITEAQVNAIPVLASMVGGIPEALGDGGILVEDFRNPQAWERGLSEVEERYDELSARAKSNAQRFSVANACKRFEEIIQAAAGERNIQPGL
jgi:glycosyltransferase involved in cell wall biosynthesis